MTCMSPGWNGKAYQFEAGRKKSENAISDCRFQIVDLRSKGFRLQISDFSSQFSVALSGESEIYNPQSEIYLPQSGPTSTTVLDAATGHTAVTKATAYTMPMMEKPATRFH